MRLITQHPVALSSPDHRHPRGTAHDNSVNLNFNEKLIAIYPHGLSLLDLGCAGGGFVKSLLDRGAFAVGIEGSDYSQVRKRAEWATIPGNLFTADITEPFRLLDDEGKFLRFDVITAWECIEHIHELDLPELFRNIDSHLKPGGRVICSISTIPDEQDGVQLHQTVRPFEWWIATLADLGWVHIPKWAQWFGVDWVRGGIQVALVDGEVMCHSNAWGSFHLVLERKSE